MLTAKEAIALLEPIPAEEFITRNYSNGVSKCCSIGHLCRILEGDPADYSELNCYPWPEKGVDRFISKTSEFTRDVWASGVDIRKVNDEQVGRYHEPIIKDRVMHFLRDMSEWESKNEQPC